MLLSIMYCPKCGAQNADDAAFCQKCGATLQTTNATTSSTPPPPPAMSTPPPSSSGGYSQAPRANEKAPIVAAILNLFFGLGYWYLGYKKVLGLQTIVFVVILLVVYFVLGFIPFAGYLDIVIAIVLAVDGYQKGQGQKGFISAEM